MVCARLHIICGNCGSIDDLKYNHDKGEYLEGEGFVEGTSIICNNCSTIHGLEEWQERKGTNT